MNFNFKLMNFKIQDFFIFHNHVMFWIYNGFSSGFHGFFALSHEVIQFKSISFDDHVGKKKMILGRGRRGERNKERVFIIALGKY